jgi:thioredoxin-related protein
MKKVFLVLALVVGLVFASCKRTNEEMSKIDAPADSTAVQADSASVDTTAIDTTAVK